MTLFTYLFIHLVQYLNSHHVTDTLLSSRDNKMNKPFWSHDAPGGLRSKLQQGQQGDMIAEGQLPWHLRRWRKIQRERTLSWFLKNGCQFFTEARRNMCSNQRTQHGERPRLEKSMVLPKKQDSSPRSDGDNGRQRGWRAIFPSCKGLWDRDWLNWISY